MFCTKKWPDDTFKKWPDDRSGETSGRHSSTCRPRHNSPPQSFPDNVRLTFELLRLKFSAKFYLKSILKLLWVSEKFWMKSNLENITKLFCLFVDFFLDLDDEDQTEGEDDPKRNDVFESWWWSPNSDHHPKPTEIERKRKKLARVKYSFQMIYANICMS